MCDEALFSIDMLTFQLNTFLNLEFLKSHLALSSRNGFWFWLSEEEIECVIFFRIKGGKEKCFFKRCGTRTSSNFHRIICIQSVFLCSYLISKSMSAMIDKVEILFIYFLSLQAGEVLILLKPVINFSIKSRYFICIS